jgi:hypothetical protein
MTDAELQAALASGAPAPATPPAANTFDVFVNQDGTSAPAAPAPASQAAPTAPAPAAGPSATEQMMHQLMQQNQQLIAQMQAQQQVAQQQAMPAPVAIPAFNVDSVLDANDKEIYKDFLPLLSKVTSAQQAYMNQHHVTPLQQRVAQLQQETQDARSHAATASETGFTATLYSRIPALPAVVNTPEWGAYLNSVAPFSGGRTVKDQVVAAYRSRDVGTISDFYQAFAARQAGAGAPPAAAPAGTAARGNAAPLAQGAPGAASPRFISQSRLDGALAAVQSGRMSRESYEKLMDDLLSAGLEGAQLVN